MPVIPAAPGSSPSVPYPKIVYRPGVGEFTLAFSYPPVKKPGTDGLSAVRHDSISTSGKRQSVTERIETRLELQMSYVPAADLVDWASFMAYALAGGPFDYYPDQTSGAFLPYQLEDVDWEPKYALRGIASFTLKMRRVM